MKILSTLIFLALLCPAHAFAAKCKIDGQWFPYDSPECSPDRSQHGGKPEKPGDDSEPLLPDNPGTPANGQPDNVPAYTRPWQEVSYEVEQRCGKYKSQPLEPARCRSREESSYWAMKSNFGLPEHIALEAKAYCTEKSPTFVSQSRCMEQEAVGYFLLTLDYAMLANYRGEAQAKCLREHSTYAERGGCMMGEETAFAEKYGHKFYEPRKVGRGWTTPKQPLVASLSGAYFGPTWTEIVGQFEANPEHPAPAQLAMNRSDPPYPLPLTTVGIQLGIIPSDTPLSGLTLDQHDLLVKTMDESTDRFRLSLQKPEVENRGFLELVAPSTVDPRRGAFFSPGSAGQVVLHLYIEQDRTYFIDFTVNSWEKARFRVTAESSDQVYEYAQDKCCHVLAKVKAKSLGWTLVTLTQDAGLGFYLHAIDVTFAPRSEWTPESVPADGS